MESNKYYYNVYIYIIYIKYSVRISIITYPYVYI